MIDGATYTTTTGTSVVVTGRTAGSSYAFRLQAYDAAGNYSPGSTAITVTTTASSGTSAYPSASNTGVPSGTTLTAYTGSSQVNTANTVISGKTINFGLVIGANNVTIQNCKIDVGQGYYWAILNDGGYTGLQILDCTLIGGTDSVVSGNFTIKRCNISGGIDGMKAANADIQDNYIHDLNYVPGVNGGDDSHNDGIQSLGTTSLLIRHNTIINGVGPTSCVLLSTGSASDMRNVTIDNNLFAGGAYCVYGGYQNGTDVLSRVSNISVTNNQISTQTWAKGGVNGAFTSCDSPVVLTGNVWYDGPKVGQSAQ